MANVYYDISTEVYGTPSISDNLYPPLVNPYMPAFLENQACRIYFSKTNFNDPSGIAHAQLSLTTVNDNLTALSSTLWPNEIKLCEIFEDTSPALANSDYKYYVLIEPRRLIDGTAEIFQDLEGTKTFERGIIYKAQIRFSSVDPSGYDGSGDYSDPSGTWFTQNQSYFSEWSKATLLKGIPAPFLRVGSLWEQGSFYVADLDDLEDISAFTNPPDGILTLTDPSADVSGWDSGILLDSSAFKTFPTDGFPEFVGGYYNADRTEPLYSYSFKLLDHSGSTLYESDIGYPDGTYIGIDGSIRNIFYFTLKTLLVDASSYYLDLTYTTKNKYTDIKRYDFIVDLDAPTLDISAVAIVDNDNGRAGFTLNSTGDVSGTLSIRRSDHTNGFTLWEPIYLAENIVRDFSGEAFFDYTLESGKIYHYWISGITLSSQILPIYEDIFLVGNNRQLKVQFDPKVSSFKYVVHDSKTDTLGSAYPFIRRNGDVKYKEFNISGLISALSDENSLFCTEEELYGQYASTFAAYNTSNRITQYNDPIREKAFRDLVMEFLYDGKPKLFKSTTEGNAIVRLTDISLTPVDSLGRMLYNFSAIATEVAEFTAENCGLYDLQVI